MVVHGFPSFIGYKHGDLVLVQPVKSASNSTKPEWWMGWVVRISARLHGSTTLSRLQVSDCDTGVLRWINTDEATRLVLSGMNSDVIPMI